MVNKLKRSIIHAVNHPSRLLAFFGIEIIVSGLLFSAFENKSFKDGVWWTIVTASTVGYGDQYPVSDAGRLVGVAVIFTNIFVIASVTSIVLSRSLEDRDRWSHEEQEQLKSDMRKVVDELDEALRDMRTAIAKMDVIYSEVDGVEEASDANGATSRQILAAVTALSKRMDAVETAPDRTRQGLRNMATKLWRKIQAWSPSASQAS